MSINDKIQSLKENFDPYYILGVNKEDNNDKIEKQFKKLILKTHPDRGGNSDLFQLVIQAYNTIYNDRLSNSGINNHHDVNQLRNQHNQFEEQRPQYENVNMSSKKFDSDKFNMVYEDNKMYNPYDDGYGDWSKEEVNDNQPKNVKESDFNNVFNQHNNHQIQKYIVPEEMYAGINIECETLGIRKIDDFTKGFSMSDNTLQYTDLKRALGGNELIIDNNIQTEDRDIQNYKSKRESCINEVNEVEQNYYKQKEIEDNNYETNRMMSLHQMDEEIVNHFNKVNRLMISR